MSDVVHGPLVLFFNFSKAKNTLIMLTLSVNNFSKTTGPFHTKYDYVANVGERGQPKGP